MVAIVSVNFVKMKLLLGDGNSDDSDTAKKDEMNKFLERALGVASTSTCRHKHGCVVVKHGRVIGYGVNRTKNDPKYVDWRHSSVHAEIAALKRANFPKRATIYVARINNLGQPRLSKPCANCQEVIDGLKCKVEYTI